MKRANVMMAVGACGLMMLAGGCSQNATTGRSQFNSLSREDEIKLGTEQLPQLTKEYGGKVANQELQAYVTEIGQKLAAQTESDNPSLPWEFTLLDSDVINAFALPGGKVFVSRGLAAKMTNEAQLAGVLGHEIGHVTARHINDQLTRETAAGFGTQILAGLAGQTGSAAVSQIAPVVIQYGGQGVLMKFSRDQESEADALGMRYMSKLGYNPLGQRQLMEILQREAGTPNGSEFFATHPYPETRIKRIDGLLKGEFASTQNNPQYTLKDQEFRQRFLNKLSAAFPAGRPVNHADERLARASLTWSDTFATRCDGPHAH
jgi:predicted Zn-dependent protease